MLGSVLCALSNSLGAFVGARFVQGMGGAMMVPVGRLVILRSVSKAELVGALAYLTVPALVGPVVGPPLGGFITTYFDWRWIFFINIPIGIVGIVLASLFFEDVREEDVAPLDIRGFLLSAFGFASLMLGLATGGAISCPRRCPMAASPRHRIARRLLVPFAAGRPSGAEPVAVQDPDLSDRRDRRLDLPDRDRCDSLPAAADAAARFRARRAAIGLITFVSAAARF